jgi:hypothetical protein
MQALNNFKIAPIQISFNKHILTEHMRLYTKKETYERKHFATLLSINKNNIISIT